MIAKHPGYWRGYYGMGVLDYRSGRFDEAFANAEMACQYNPPAAPYMLRGTLHLNHRKDPDAALSDFSKAISFHEKGSPFEYQARLEMGKIYTSKEQYANADSILGEAIAVNPNGIEALMARGMAYVDNLGLPEKGMADFIKVLELSPGQNDAELGIGFCYFKMNLHEEAIHQYNQILAQRPNEGRVWYFRALAYASAGRFREAWLDGLKAVESGFPVNSAEIDHWKSAAGIR
jgi:tetratricopeptide (TPR) repeat protein